MKESKENPGRQKRVATGISGLDEVLRGGLVPGRFCLVRGGPGTGKTTMGLHYLAKGAGSGEPVLYITLSESEEHIRESARSIGLELDQVAFLDLSPTSEFFAEVESYDLFSPAEVEREPITRAIADKVQALKPSRVLVDSITQFRFLSTDPYQFHKQILSFTRFLLEHGATVLATSESSEPASDADLQFLADAVINLESGHTGRYVHVSKFRGSNFRAGKHSMSLTGEGMVVHPKLLPEEHRRAFEPEPLSFGLTDLDELLRGGLERGTISIITGPPGVGKTTLGAHFMKEAAGRGERSVLYTFEEEVDFLVRRCEAIHIPARTMIERGTLAVIKIEPLRYTADEFAGMVRQEVEEHGTSIVMIDSLSGYQLSLTGEDLVSHLHALCKYLQYRGMTTLLINEKHTISGAFTATEKGISYLADNILYLRYMEHTTAAGTREIRRGIGVLKKRLSDYDSTLREIQLTPYGIKVNPAITGLQSILSELPSWSTPEQSNGS